MADEKVVTPEEMSYEQLIEATNKAAATEAAKPRDEQGRFVAQGQTQEETPQDPPPAAEEDTQAAPAEKLVYQKVIDLGDGSGSQVFEADSMEELVDKLADAQKHASKKIRELSQEKRAEKVVEAAPTDDQEWARGQELLSKPTQTMKRMFEEYVGEPIESFKSKVARLDAFEQAQREYAEAQKFVAAHPEYVVNDRNATKIERTLKIQGLEATHENIEKVYAELAADGLLALKEAESTTTDETAPTPRIASSGARVVSVQGRAASGISGKRSAPAPPTPKEPTEAELYAMPMDKLELYYNTKAAQQQK